MSWGLREQIKELEIKVITLDNALTNLREELRGMHTDGSSTWLWVDDKIRDAVNAVLDKP